MAKRKTQTPPRPEHRSGDMPAPADMTAKEAMELIKRTIRFRPPGSSLDKAIQVLEERIGE